MALSRKHLSEDEEIVYHMRTHVKEIFLPLFILVVIGAGGGVGAAALAGTDAETAGRLAILVVGVILLVWWVLWPILNWLVTTYIVTTQRLITRTGVFTRSGRAIPHEHIHDVAYEQSVLDRILRCGTLVVSSASEHGTVRLRDVPQVHEVQLRLSELVREAAGDEVENR